MKKLLIALFTGCVFNWEVNLRAPRSWPAPQDHPAVMQGVQIDEVAIGRETCVVPVFDICSVDFVTPLVGAFALVARFVVAPIG